MVVGAPAQGIPVLAVVQVKAVASKQSKDGVHVAGAMNPICIQTYDGGWLRRGRVDPGPITSGRVNSIDQRTDQTEHCVTQRLGTVQVCAVDARGLVDQA